MDMYKNRLNHPREFLRDKGLYIMRQGNKVTKVYVSR